MLASVLVIFSGDDDNDARVFSLCMKQVAPRCRKNIVIHLLNTKKCSNDSNQIMLFHNLIYHLSHFRIKH